MVALNHDTPPLLDTPAYAADEDGTMIHRYMDTGFVAQFIDQAKGFSLTGTAQQTWRSEDQFGKHANGSPTLRLPLHKTFYVVSVEASCDQPGRPALDPRRVASAGFVVRRGSAGNAQAWMLQNGVAAGWQPLENANVEPDERRRAVNVGLLGQRALPGRYSGEQTYPLRPLLVEGKVLSDQGTARKRTLLHGFLPLSGEAPVKVVEAQAVSEAPETVSGRLAEQAWPFGSWNGSGDDDDPTLDAFVWSEGDGIQILNGKPTPAMAEFLRTLLIRYHVHDETIAANLTLRQHLEQLKLRFSVDPFALAAEDLRGKPALIGTTPYQHFLDYLEKSFDALAAWFGDQDKQRRDDPDHEVERLPGLGDLDLFISETMALDLREALVARGEAAELDLAKSLPVPRYQQGVDDKFFVRPFLRYTDDCGCERLVWGPPSKPFRVVSPLDPEASAPTAVQLPGLDDLKRGMAKGVTFLTPKSLMDAMDKITPDLAFEEKKSNPLSVCQSYALSFSIPIVTICALILLMILINILHFFLQWLPYAFIRLSLKCKGEAGP